MMSELALQKVEKVKKALEEGRRVFIGGVEVRKIDIVRGKRGGFLVVVNDGEMSWYLSKFASLRVDII